MTINHSGEANKLVDDFKLAETGKQGLELRYFALLVSLRSGVFSQSQMSN